MSNIELGLHFNLNESVYHADKGLGSTDIKRLASSPYDFWFHKFGGGKGRKVTDEMLIGRALHSFVLEGEAALKRSYAPTWNSGTTKEGKAEREAIRNSGRTAIRGDDWQQILLTGTMIKRHHYLSNAFTDGKPEVSIIWESEGIRRKARIDYLRGRASVDLKSMRNTRDIDFREACLNSFATMKMETQLAHYAQARRAARRFIEDGQVFGSYEKDFLDAVYKAGNRFASIVIFCQLDGAPLVDGMQLSPENPLLEYGESVIQKAEYNWKENMERYGDDPWILNEPIKEIDLTDFPMWSYK